MWTLLSSERLIIAADYKPEEYRGRIDIQCKILELAFTLQPTGACLKLNSAARALGLDLVDRIHHVGMRACLDWKLVDIDTTLENDGGFIREAKPTFLTAMCAANVEPLRRLKAALPDTCVLGVTVPTTWTERDCKRVYGCSIADAVARLSDIACEAGLDGIICAPNEARDTRSSIGKDRLIATPGVRFADESVSGDDQDPERVMTPLRACQAGSDIIIMGRPITGAASPLEAARRALREMESV